MVSNTTEEEFKHVVDGICKQMKAFKDQCLAINAEYSDIIYNTLTKDLDPNAACFAIGICPKALTQQKSEVPYQFMPLIPNELLLTKKKVLGEQEPVYTTEQIQSFQLPKDVLLLDADTIQKHVVKKNPQFCTLCEYFLHFAQEALASPKNEEEIKNVVLDKCLKLPKSVQGQCQSFVDMYSDAIIALIIQDIDPSEVCPRMGFCVSKRPTANEKCPLCLFLVQDIEEQLKGNKSKANIMNKLNGLCSRLRDDLRVECVDFINTYAPELIDKLANDFTPKEICLNLKCCTEREEVFVEKLGDKKSYNDYREY